jgi:hypothetical protein
VLALENFEGYVTVVVNGARVCGEFEWWMIINMCAVYL